MGLVEGGCFAIDCDRHIPEMTDEHRAAGVVPDVNRNRSAGIDDAPEFLQRARRTRDEI